jgi:hypothetical protein
VSSSSAGSSCSKSMTASTASSGNGNHSIARASNRHWEASIPGRILPIGVNSARSVMCSAMLVASRSPSS